MSGSPEAHRTTDHEAWVACCLGQGPAAPLSRDDLELLAADMTEVLVAGGTCVFRRGERAASVYVVRHGSVQLSRDVQRRRVMLQLLGTGDAFGDVPALLGREAPFDARAVEDSVLLRLHAPSLFALLRTRPGVAGRWFVSLAERMSDLHDRLLDLLAGGLDAQLASVLLRRGRGGDDVRLTQGQLAELLGVSRSSVQRVLKSMEAAGLIDLHYRRVELVDAAGLASLVEDGSPGVPATV